MANWNAGFWFASEFGLRFAHTPFSSEKWESLLGFGENEVNADELVREKGYKKILLPLFNEFNKFEINRIKNIIASYANKRVVFYLEQDQGYKNQYGVMHDLQTRFYASKIRINDSLEFSPNNYNIAIHIRRGDIISGQSNKNQNLLMRWQDSEYFENVLNSALKLSSPKKRICIYLFSQGSRKDFLNFQKFDNIHFCLDMGPHESFLHMVYADLLITSKSSFSYKAALLSRGIKICPLNFWHGYPVSEDWIIANENGLIDEKHNKHYDGK